MKNNRSEWMEGLLLAEALIREGYILDEKLSDGLWFVKRECKTVFYHSISYPHQWGALDYLEHYENNLKNL